MEKASFVEEADASWSICHKCGTKGGHGVMYWSGSTAGTNKNASVTSIMGGEGERLILTCRTCDYMWTEKCKDAGRVGPALTGRTTP